MIYLDNSATTKVSKNAADKALYMMCENFGNPSSLYSLGFSAELEIKKARHTIALALSSKDGEIFFTSGGTEANNTAILGVADALKRRGNKIVISAIEHSSVLEAAQSLENNGFEVVFAKPDERGIVTSEEVSRLVDEKTILVSVMLVNNEIGSIMDVATIAAAARRKSKNVVVHCDAVQGFLKIPVNVGRLGVDVLSVSGHKISAPKGIGAIYVKKGTRINPRFFGGEQQNKFRPGTENSAFIAAFGVACEDALKTMAESYKKVKELNAHLVSRLNEIESVTINSNENCLPYIVNFSTNLVKSETMLHFLEKKEIFVSSGSACAKGKKSHVLSALNLNDRAIDTAIRVSFNCDNTLEEIDELVSAVKEGIDTLQHIK